MTRALLRKELSSLVPFLALVLFFNLLNWGDELLTKFPDQYSLAELFKVDEGEQVLLFIVAFALAASLLVREADEGTLGFLDALPLSRALVFFTKASLALGVLWLLPLSDLALKATLYHWSRTSLEPHVRWSPLVTSTSLSMASGFVYLSCGLALSFLRKFSFLVLGLLFCAYLFLEQRQIPFVSLLNIFALDDPVFQGRHWLIPTTKLAVQLVIGIAALGIAFVAFTLTGDAARKLVERARRRRSLALLGAAAIGLGVVLWAGLLVYWGQHSNERQPGTVTYADWPTARARTARYRFIYPANLAGAVDQLLDRADGIERRVRQFLSAQPIPWIVADLTGSERRNAGVAHWKQVQIDLAAVGPGVEELTAVFGHETTHVYIDHESQEHIDDDFNSTRFFHEGLASYTEYHLFRPPNQLLRLRRVAAVMQARHEVNFEELLDSRALSRKYDTDLVYPLGEVFVNALVKAYGEATPGRVLRAFGRAQAPSGLKGPELWADTLQACGGNLTEVEDRFFAELDQAAAEQGEFIESLPRLRGIVRQEADYIEVRANHEGSPPGRLLCRFRAQADTPDDFYEYARDYEPAVFRVPNVRYTERSFWYQLGWFTPEASQPIYEPWVEVTRN